MNRWWSKHPCLCSLCIWPSPFECCPKLIRLLCSFQGDLQCVLLVFSLSWISSEDPWSKALHLEVRHVDNEMHPWKSTERNVMIGPIVECCHGRGHDLSNGKNPSRKSMCNRWSLCTDSRSSTQHMKEHAPLLESISWPTAAESVNPGGASGHLRKYRTEVEAGFHWFQGINEGITQFPMPRWMLLWGSCMSLFNKRCAGDNMVFQASNSEEYICEVRFPFSAHVNPAYPTLLSFSTLDSNLHHTILSAANLPTYFTPVPGSSTITSVLIFTTLCTN